MKRWIKSLALLLVLCLLSVGLISCGNTEEAPEGMKAANLAGDDFRLYVPTTWTLNTAYGVAGAYADMDRQSTVSAVKYPRTEELLVRMTEAGAVADAGTRSAWFWENECLPMLREKALNGEITMDSELTADTVLGGLNAKQYRFRLTVNGNKLCVHQVVAERTQKVEEVETVSYYVLSFLCLDELYTSFSPTAEKILEVFVFSETPYVPTEKEKPAKDSSAPEGMKLVSNDDVAYRFYAPTSWETTVNDGIFSAYVKEDRANVSVIPYCPDGSEGESFGVEKYFAMSEEQIKLHFGESNYEYLADAYRTTTLGGRKAHEYRYRIRIGGTVYEYRQVIGAYRGMIYCVTYTAAGESFEKHNGEFDAILSAFTYR